MEHTKWKIILATDSVEYAYIAVGNQYIVQNVRVEHARRICKCVNNFDNLLDACKEGKRRLAFLHRHRVKNMRMPMDRIELEKTESCINFITQAISEAEAEKE
jgi:hypothetical protein